MPTQQFSERLFLNALLVVNIGRAVTCFMTEPF